MTKSKEKGEFDYGCWKDRDDLLNAIRHENKLMNKKFKFEKPHNIKNRKKDEGQNCIHAAIHTVCDCFDHTVAH